MLLDDRPGRYIAPDMSSPVKALEMKRAKADQDVVEEMEEMEDTQLTLKSMILLQETTLAL